jgi:hypothetical protein
MKFVKIIKNIFVGALVLAFFTFATIMALTLIYRNDYGVTQFGDTSLVMVNSKLAIDEYKKGNLIIVEGKALKDFALGDEIFVYVVEEDNSVNIDIGKIGEIDLDERRIKLENGGYFKDKYIIGEAAKNIPTLGTILSVIGSTMGFLFIVLIPCFLIFIYQIYALIVEIRYGKHE